jgi:FkbM family methyltransferase
VFVDVGSSVGAFTLPAAKRVGSTGRVIAIEPSPRVFPYLQRNVERNGLRIVRLKRCAVTDRNQGMVPFYEAPVEHFGMGSLAPQFQAAPTEVTAQTLDSLLLEEAVARADVLKVDVEGFEASVFRGAERLLAGRLRPSLCSSSATRQRAGCREAELEMRSAFRWTRVTRSTLLMISSGGDDEP